MRRKFWYRVISILAILVVGVGIYGLLQSLGNALSGSAAPTAPAEAQSGAASSTTESQIAQAVFAAINKDREAAGLPALGWSDALVQGAHKHNQAMASANQLSHQLPGEADLGKRVTQDGLKWWWVGENIGQTTDATVNGALAIHKAMMAEQPPEDGHRKNILTTEGKLIGIDVLIDANHQLWITEDFAKV
ncbi:CAP domain-containing protein [Ktedonosporobacter rubrisoli]|uniref:CAP domain-containing protein n=1 Tax=Ktedonosporobacter rubrisoli TaxID=2509675 RepID=UPI0013EE9788|nr:CAP domain-containing protein [Ktedonosporobacter rubrisoli]